MPDNRTYYVICEDGCRFEGMTKAQIIENILAEVEEHGTRKVTYNAPFSAKEINAGKEFSLWIGTQAEYNALSSTEENVLYIIAEDNAAKQSIIDDIDDINDDLEAMETDIESVMNGVAALKLAKDQQQAARQEIRDDIADFTNRKNAMTERIAADVATASAINSTFTSYKTDRETLTTLWSGSQAISTTAVTFSIDWTNYQELLFVVEIVGAGTYYAATDNMIYFPTKDIAGETFKHNMLNAPNDCSGSNNSEYIYIKFSEATAASKTIEISKGSWTGLTLIKIIGIGDV